MGWPEVLMLTPLLVGIVVPFLVSVIVAAVMWRGLGRRAAQFGYRSRSEFLRAAPATDDEKRHAADLMLKGVIICLCGLLFPPALLVGAIPLFYGARKVCYASMGLGLVDDGTTTRRA